MSTHRYHHQFVDTEKDPHSPIKGFWSSHIIWLLYTGDGSLSEMLGRHRKWDNACDLENQTFYRFIHKTYFLHQIALALILYGIGGFPYFIWGMVKELTSIVICLIPWLHMINMRLFSTFLKNK